MGEQEFVYFWIAQSFYMISPATALWLPMLHHKEKFLTNDSNAVYPFLQLLSFIFYSWANFVSVLVLTFDVMNVRQA